MKAELLGGPMDGAIMEIDDGRTVQMFRPMRVDASDYPQDFDVLVEPPAIPAGEIVYRRTRTTRHDCRIFRYEGVRL